MIEVGLILYALHIADNSKENFTPGIQVTHIEQQITVGVLRNSYRNTSVFVTKNWKVGCNKCEISTGVISGYSVAPLLPLLSFNYSVSDNLKLSYLPPNPKGTAKYGTLVTSWTF